jgi:hypothetical protein
MFLATDGHGLTQIEQMLKNQMNIFQSYKILFNFESCSQNMAED